jgi:DNA-binding CsgD family transcriptional regulator
MPDSPPTLDAVDATDRQREVAEYVCMYGPVSRAAVAETFDVAENTVSDHLRPYRDAGVIELTEAREYVHHDTDITDDSDEADTTLPNLDDIDLGDEPDPSDLTDREEYIATELTTGATVAGLADELDERESVITQHLRDLKREGWQVYVDETAGQVALEGDHTLRSSEHTGTRTRKANQWWELRHSALVREFNGLQAPTGEQAHTAGGEDWVLHLTDLHAGDVVRRDDGTVVYQTEDIPDVIDYVTEQALSLADTHAATYDTAHLLWGGDFLTNEGIYEGQFEDLDAWLDEQHDTLVAPLVRQLKAFAERFPSVNVVSQVGNHGEHRASGTSKQANADLVLFKTIRNVVAELRKEVDILSNVTFRIGQAQAYRNFDLRDGRLRGHLRHGQHRRPQAETSARKKEWLSTLREHEFDLAFMGHHHVSGRLPWDGPPILATASPKPSGEFVERIGESVATDAQDMATVCGVSDDGVTSIFPIDSRNYTPE